MPENVTEEQLAAIEARKTQLKEMLGPIVGDLVKNALNEAVSGDGDSEWAKAFRGASHARKQFIAGPVPEEKKGIGAARFVRALAFGGGSVDKAIFFAKKVWDDDLGDQVAKALEAGTFTAGGFMVPPDFLPDIIELLRSRTVVRRAGPRILPMDSGTLTLRRQTQASTATYIGESEDIDKTQPAGGQIVMTAKKLAAIVPISNDLLTFTSSPAADEFVRDDLVQVLAIREDQAFIRDDGLENKPKGLRFWVEAGNVSVTNGETATNIEEDFKDMINALETNDVPLIRPVWFMNPRSKNHLVNLRDANGNLIFPEIRGASPTMYGYPVFVSTNIPVNLGAGTETEIYFVDMNDAIIGEVGGLQIAVDSSASYVETGSLVSSFARDETVIRAIQRHDFAMRHDVSIGIKNEVIWGA